MPFKKDREFAARIEPVYGEYETTFTSEQGQVRADLFRKGSWLEAHVSFSDGVDPTKATDSYVDELRDYAREKGYTDRFRMIFSE